MEPPAADVEEARNLARTILTEVAVRLPAEVRDACVSTAAKPAAGGGESQPGTAPPEYLNDEDSGR